MMRAEITGAELVQNMVPGMSPEHAHNLALELLLSKKGIKFKRRSLFGLAPPDIAAPYKVWRNEYHDSWTVEQG